MLSWSGTVHGADLVTWQQSQWRQVQAFLLWSIQYDYASPNMYCRENVENKSIIFYLSTNPISQRIIWHPLLTYILRRKLISITTYQHFKCQFKFDYIPQDVPLEQSLQSHRLVCLSSGEPGGFWSDAAHLSHWTDFQRPPRRFEKCPPLRVVSCTVSVGQRHALTTCNVWGHWRIKTDISRNER